MSGIPTYSAPYGDQDTNATITAPIWNGMFDSIASYLNTQVVPAINGAAGTGDAFPGAIWFIQPGTAIPTGWVICDGNNGTPNLIGMYIFGGRPAGSSSAANANGYGAVSEGTVFGTTSHSHGASASPSGVPRNCASGSSFSCYEYPYDSVGVTVYSTATEPASIALTAIMFIG